MSAEITVRWKLARGNHEQSIKMKIVKLLPLFLFLHETMLQKNEKCFRKNDLPETSAIYPCIFYVSNKQLLVVPSLHQQSITFVLSMISANKYETK